MSTGFVNEGFEIPAVTQAQLDWLLANGWRHFGTQFFRYERTYSSSGWLHVQPLRLQVDSFSRSSSQTRIWKRNQDLRVVIQDALIDDEKHALFERHKTRFTDNIPESLYTFMSTSPANTPCPNLEISLYDADTLVATHFLDIGATSTSSVNSIFEPTLTRRSLGVYTILLALHLSKQLGKTLYYPGYAYREPSGYDYKKRLGKLEVFDWRGAWRPLEPALVKSD
jgi:leucyl-tRNA---protein transferase